MKYVFFITILVILGCSNRESDFDKYLDQVERLPTPLIIKTIEFTGRTSSQLIDTILFEKFKILDAQTVYGKIYEDNNFTGIIYNVPGDISVPVLVTYRKNGEKIDSLNLFKNASGVGLEIELFERLILRPDMTIHVIDSLVKWDLNKVGDERIEGSGRESIDSFYYFIRKDGRIGKNRR